MSIRSVNRNGPTAGLQPLVLTAIVAVTGLALWFAISGTGWLRAESTELVRGSSVQRGPLKIDVVERGNLKAADSVSIKNEIEGQTTILYLIPEGTLVEEGTLLCELDATDLIDRRFQQEISVRNAEAAHVKSKQTYEIQKSQNDSDIAKAEQKLLFAQKDLEKFLAEEGERTNQLAKAEEQITLNEEQFKQAESKLDWSRQLYEKGYLTKTELETDELSLSRARIQAEAARREKDLLERFQLARSEIELRSGLSEAERELERVKLQAAARIVDYEADMRTNEAKLRLEQEKLSKLETQIAKAKIHSPRSGMVVYAQEESRYGSSQPMKEGTQVRERQEIITIPSAEGMIAQASLHESVLKEVEVGQRVTIQVDALPGQEFHGSVHLVAVLPDQNSWWANPNTRLYRTEITIEDASLEMRPGMSCAIDILVDEIPDTLFVPVQAVFRDNAENVAFVDQNGDTQRRAVEVGRYNDRWVQILAGLSEGETVLLAPPAGFVPQAGASEGATEGTEEAPKPGGPAQGERPQGGAMAAMGEAGTPAAGAAGRKEHGPEGARSAEDKPQHFGEMSDEERARQKEQFRSRRGREGGPPASDGARGGTNSGSGG